MNNSYTSVVEAIEALKKEGFTEDFNLCDAGVEHKVKKVVYGARDFNVIKFFRFEGDSNPDDNSILYAIETSAGEKGVLLDAYGVYSGNVPKELTDKLKIHYY